MRQAAIRWVVALGISVAGALAAPAQSPAQPAAHTATPANTAPSTVSTPQAVAAPAVAGGRLHGLVKSGNIPLPGVTVTAANTLTGKRYATTTDIAGAWSLNIPQNGRYVIRTQFAAFAAGSQEAVLNAASHDQAVDFSLMLASRAAAQQQQQDQQGTQAAQAVRQLMGNGAQSLSLTSSLAEGTDTQSGTPASSGSAGAALPSIAGSSDFSSESVAIAGQAGAVSPMAGIDMDRVRDAIETMRAQGGAGGNFGGLAGGGFGGPGGGFGGFGGGGRGNFRGFNPSQPHGAIFWTGSNSALNAEPFALRGQSQQQPASGTNRFGLTFMSAPYLPGVSKPSGKDTVFLTLSGQRSSSPLDEYATVPTDSERAGDFTGQPAIYNPVNGQQFSYRGQPNVIPTPLIAPQATALLKYFPQPNLPGTVQNYHLLSTAQNNNTAAGIRYLRSLGPNASLLGMGRGGAGSGNRRSQNQGLRQSINFNYNYSYSAQDDVNIFPQLGGKGSTTSNSLQAGYTVGYHKLTDIFNASWNRNNAQANNFFTNGPDISTQLGILGPDGGSLNSSPLNYGIPNVTLGQTTGLSEQQPTFALSQTISLSETLSWIYGKHNLRFGGDYRRVHRDVLGSSNATGAFYFSGLFTEAPQQAPQNPAQNQNSGSAIADLLLGLPQETTIDSAIAKSYLRDNVFDVYAMDDWRVLPSLTLNYGLRYDFYAPYTEKYNHLAMVDTNPSAGFTGTAEVPAGGVGPYSGKLPDSLVSPFRLGVSPRVSIALRLPKQTVVRSSYGINYTVGEYASFASTMSHEPPFADEQTNEAAAATGQPSTACAQRTPPDCFTLGNGFPTPATVGNYALDPHYQLPYIQAWHLDVQRTIPWGIVLNVGYNGSKGNHLDIASAPRATASSPRTDPTNLIFNYDQALAFSKFSAGTLRANKRLSSGVSLGANYQYSHSIDNAGALGGTSTVVAQNWQNLNDEEGNSSLDQRHKVSGTYLYELPFGKDKFWITSGAGSHILEGLSVSGSFTFATGTPLSPTYQAAVSSVACGTAGTLRPDRVPGVSLTGGAGSLKRWFNPGAFTEPSAANSSYPCDVFGNAARNSIRGPGTIQNNLSLSKTMQLGDTRSMEIRATASNAFNTVQYSGVDTNVSSPSFGQITGIGSMRAFNFTARFRF
jgi:hypothetical protein